MAQVTSYERARSDLPAFEFEDISNERLRLHPSAYTALPTIGNEGDALEVQNPTELDRSNSTSSSYQVDSTKHGEPRAYATLRRSAWHEWGSKVFDTVMTFFPIFFLVIAVLCLCLNDKPVSAYGQSIKAITLLSPTIFPIVYAAILGKLFRRAALFKAERGSSVGTLEQLMGSQSFFASIERQFGMRQLRLLGIGILAAWLLSPLGGQLSLRLLSTKLSDMAINTTIQYHPIEIFGKYSRGGEHLEDYYWATYGPLFLTSLQTSRDTFNRSRDFLGNIRIPDITSLHHYVDTTSSSVDWYDVGNDSSVAYTSLLGAPIIDVPPSANVTFTIESGYWEVLCTPFSANFTIDLINQTRIGNSRGKTSFDMRIKSDGGKNSTLVAFDYFSKISTEWAIRSNCTAGLRAVHSEVGCIEGLCDVRRMRHSSRDMWPIFSNASLWHSIRYVTQFLPGIDMGPGDQYLRSSELVEQWMADPYLMDFIPSYGGQAWKGVNLAYNLSTEAFARRLQLVFNTFTDSLLGMNYRTRLSLDGSDGVPWNGTTATGVQFDSERYVCNIVFAVLVIVISFLLFVAATATVVLGINTRAPDILGYVSTLARDNPYLQVKIPSHIDGLEATRALRDIRVIVGDVNQEADIGHVAFASVHVGPGRVSRTRMYD